MSRKTRTFAVALAAAVFAVNALASPAVRAQSKASAKAETHSLAGALEKYDPATNTITITAVTGGPQTLTLAPNAQIRSGKAALTVRDLTPQVGHQVRVQYTEAGGLKMAQSVAIQAGAPSNARASKTSKR